LEAASLKRLLFMLQKSSSNQISFVHILI